MTTITAIKTNPRAWMGARMRRWIVAYQRHRARRFNERLEARHRRALASLGVITSHIDAYPRRSS